MSSSLRIAAYFMTWFCFLLGIFSCLLRVYSCVFVKHAWKADDYLGLLVLVSPLYLPIQGHVLIYQAQAALIGALYFWETALILGCGKYASHSTHHTLFVQLMRVLDAHTTDKI